MAPYADNLPAGLAQQRVCRSVSPGIPLNFLLPVRPVALRHPAVPPASVPEATINEHRHALTPENKIWLPGQCQLPPPAANPICPENSRQPHFGLLITDRAHSRHHLGALLSRKHVR